MGFLAPIGFAIATAMGTAGTSALIGTGTAIALGAGAVAAAGGATYAAVASSQKQSNAIKKQENAMNALIGGGAKQNAEATVAGATATAGEVLAKKRKVSLLTGGQTILDQGKTGTLGGGSSSTSGLKSLLGQ